MKGQNAFMYWALSGCLVNNGVTSERYWSMFHFSRQPPRQRVGLLSAVSSVSESRCRATTYRPEIAHVNTPLLFQYDGFVNKANVRCSLDAMSWVVFQVMPFSTACSTPLSNFEAGQNYKDVQDPAGE